MRAGGRAAAVTGRPGPVTMGGQGKGRGAVCCASVVVAPVWDRGHSSLQGGAILPLMVYTHGAGQVWVGGGYGRAGGEPRGGGPSRLNDGGGGAGAGDGGLGPGRRQGTKRG